MAFKAQSQQWAQTQINGVVPSQEERRRKKIGGIEKERGC